MFGDQSLRTLIELAVEKCKDQCNNVSDVICISKSRR